MSKKITGYIKLQIKGGSANPSPPIGPALGSKGLNIVNFCKQFNDQTKDQKDEVLPVVITVYEDKSFSFLIKTPPTANLIMKAIDIKKGSESANRKKVGKINQDQIKKIAEQKMPDLNTYKLESAIKMVIGTAKSLGVTIQKTSN